MNNITFNRNDLGIPLRAPFKAFLASSVGNFFVVVFSF